MCGIVFTAQHGTINIVLRYQNFNLENLTHIFVDLYIGGIGKF